MNKNTYRKEIEVTSTGMVVARVRNSKGESQGLKFYSQFSSTNKAVERSCKKAHKWADERIKVCQRQETNYD